MGDIHVLRKQVFGFFDPLPPYKKVTKHQVKKVHMYYLKVKSKLSNLYNFQKRTKTSSNFCFGRVFVQIWEITQTIQHSFSKLWLRKYDNIWPLVFQFKSIRKLNKNLPILLGPYFKLWCKAFRKVKLHPLLLGICFNISKTIST